MTTAMPVCTGNEAPSAGLEMLRGPSHKAGNGVHVCVGIFLIPLKIVGYHYICVWRSTGRTWSTGYPSESDRAPYM